MGIAILEIHKMYGALLLAMVLTGAALRRALLTIRIDISNRSGREREREKVFVLIGDLLNMDSQ